LESSLLEGLNSRVFLDAFMLYFITLHPRLFSRIYVSIWWFSFLGVCFLREFGFIKNIIYNINNTNIIFLVGIVLILYYFFMQVSLLVSRSI
jgi:hypothetical protein